MERGEKTILVTGGTGHQGGATARHLLADGWRVRALVRDAGRPAARELERLGADLVVGDMLDPATLTPAARGAYGVYSVQTLAGGAADEITQARNIADAAKSAGVAHFVQDTVFGADRDAGMPWVVSKHQIEVYLAASGLPVTIWRPVTFMENYLRQRESIASGVVSGPDGPDTMRRLIAVNDIGRFVALSFSDPDTWIGRSTEIAGDRLTNAAIAETFASVLGTSVVYERRPAQGTPAPKPPAADAPPPREVDLESLRTLLPDLATLADWIRASW